MPTWVLVAIEHLFTFGVGITVGFLLSNKFKIVRRNGNGRKGE